METIGIIAEYNPFHNGHIYQINEIKKKYKDSRVSYSKELHYHPSYIGKDGKTHNHRCP